MKTKQISPVFIKSPTVDVYFDIAVDGYKYDVKGFMDVRTREFTPELVSVFSVQQFATEVAKTTVEAFVADLRKMVTKDMKGAK